MKEKYKIYPVNIWEGCGRTEKYQKSLPEIKKKFFFRTFARLGFKTGRLSTGTPPRLLSSTINYDKFTKQATDEEPIPFSFLNSKVGIPKELQLASYVGYTNDNLVKIVRENIDEKHSLISALNEGIKGGFK